MASKAKPPGQYVDTVDVKRSAREKWWARNGARDLLQVQEKFGVGGEFADHYAMQKRFGLLGWQFGGYVNQEDRFCYVLATSVSLHHLAGILEVPPAKLGKGVLSIAIGVRGTPNSLATFWPGFNQINLNRWQAKSPMELFALRIKREDRSLLSKRMG